MKQIVKRTNRLVCLPISVILILPVVIFICAPDAISKVTLELTGDFRTKIQVVAGPTKFIICIRSIRNVYDVSPDLDIALLRTFVAIVDTGGLTSAGRKVGRSQPAITHQITRLEEGLGRPVFGCDRRRLSLTRDGEILLEYARAMLRLNDEARNRFSAPEVAGHVTLGTPDLYAAYLLPEVLANFSRSFPNIEIQLRCTRSIHLHAALEREELDIALMTNQPEFKRGDIIRHEPIVWVAGTRGEPEVGNPLPLAMLPHGSVYRQIALEALGAVGRQWSIRSMCDSIAGLQAAVFAGLAVSVFPRCAIVPGIRCLGTGEGLPILPPIELVLHRKESVSEAAEQLARYIARELAEGRA
jgi:DNA-binding transcriptional LysR family regulator